MIISLGLRIVHGMGDQVDPVLRAIVLQQKSSSLSLLEDM
jgi:hypothetical protein